jgi:pimeloyl-ACP methyl ester carboxylesterase
VTPAPEQIRMRVHGRPEGDTLIHLPGIHGDWTLVSSFRRQLAGKVCFVELAYPCTTTWSLDDHAREIEAALAGAGIHAGWLLGESFGSQPAWQMLGRLYEGKSPLNLHGLVLAGGFVKHPWPWGARLLRGLTRMTPRCALRVLLTGYTRYARIRHRRAPEMCAGLQEFRTNRLVPGDSVAMQHRYALVAEADVRPIARATRLPVYHLAGLIDPIVPGPHVRRWLQNHCPGFRASKTIRAADHNVLGSAPESSAALVLEWMGQIDKTSARTASLSMRGKPAHATA